MGGKQDKPRLSIAEIEEFLEQIEASVHLVRKAVGNLPGSTDETRGDASKKHDRKEDKKKRKKKQKKQEKHK